MKVNFSGTYKYTPRILMQKCGYGLIVDRKNKKGSFVKRLSTGLYPRFHIYIDHKEKGFTVSLHLDQKKASYTGNTAHSGEYDGHLVEVEMEKIKKIIDYYKLNS